MSRGDGEVYLRGDTLWICYYHRGIRHRESAHTDDPRKARRLLRERLVDHTRGKTAAIVAGKLSAWLWYPPLLVPSHEDEDPVAIKNATILGRVLQLQRSL